jgi:demethylmenaquinone methyltransferase/2-methoxy-6-polyprenyl-1,4-benzoquinol methylase
MVEPLSFIQGNAENLPFANNTFDRIMIGFGLRNVTDKESALKSLYRILKPGGRLIILEFSHPTNPLLGKLYDLYSFNILPTLGKWVANDSESYQYLAESIRMHPCQEKLKSMIIDAGFDKVDFHNLTGGIVAIHKGIKY